ncbi:MAG: WG repeat-containing protein [Hydrogenophaga sp.]
MTTLPSEPLATMPRQLHICLPTRQPWRCLLIDAQGHPLGSPDGFLRVRGFDSEAVDSVFYSAAQAPDGRWGFIDTEGQWRVPPQYEDTRNAAPNGMARFRQNGLWGYIRMDGQVLIEALYEEARPFRHGVAAVKLPGKGWRFIDESGAFTGSKEHDELAEMGREGLAWAGQRDWAPKGGRRRIGFVDREGRWVIEPTFGYANPFGDHAVTAATLDYNHYGLIDTRGQWVLEPQRDWRIETFDDDGLASFLVAKGNHERGFINTQGQVCIPPGRNLGETRSCGLARAWTQYYRADGERMEPAARLSMASDFRPGARVAVVRLDRLKAHGNQPAQERNWGLLHTDGRIVPMPPHLREPLTDADDRLQPEYLNTPWVAFIDHAGDLVWVDGECQEQARVRLAPGQARLHTAAGEVWSTTLADLGPVQPYYAPHTAQVLQTITEVAGVAPLAEQLCALIEERLHQAASGQTPEPLSTPRDDEDDDEDEDQDADDETDDDAPAADSDWRGNRRETRRMARLLRTERRLSRHYLGETHSADDQFLTSEWSEHSTQLHDALRQVLTDRYGPPDVLPEWAGWHESHLRPLGWAVPLSQPLPGDGGRLAEHRQLWVCLHHASDSGDGDVWWENWLLVAPSVDALALALRARGGRPRGAPPPPPAAAPRWRRPSRARPRCAPRPARPRTRRAGRGCAGSRPRSGPADPAPRAPERRRDRRSPAGQPLGGPVGAQTPDDPRALCTGH